MTALLRWPDTTQAVNLVAGYPIVGDLTDGAFSLITTYK